MKLARYSVNDPRTGSTSLTMSSLDGVLNSTLPAPPAMSNGESDVKSRVTILPVMASVGFTLFDEMKILNERGERSGHVKKERQISVSSRDGQGMTHDVKFSSVSVQNAQRHNVHRIITARLRMQHCISHAQAASAAIIMSET